MEIACIIHMQRYLSSRKSEGELILYGFNQWKIYEMSNKIQIVRKVDWLWNIWPKRVTKEAKEKINQMHFSSSGIHRIYGKSCGRNRGIHNVRVRLAASPRTNLNDKTHYANEMLKFKGPKTKRITRVTLVCAIGVWLVYNREMG